MRPKENKFQKARSTLSPLSSFPSCCLNLGFIWHCGGARPLPRACDCGHVSVPYEFCNPCGGIDEPHLSEQIDLTKEP